MDLDYDLRFNIGSVERSHFMILTVGKEFVERPLPLHYVACVFENRIKIHYHKNCFNESYHRHPKINLYLDYSHRKQLKIIYCSKFVYTNIENMIIGCF